MRAVILYSQHEAGQQAQAQTLAAQLGAYASALDVLEVYGSALGKAMLDLFAVREFPAVVFVQDHLAGNLTGDYLRAAAAEQQDVESREHRKAGSNHLQAVLEQATEAGREEIRKQVREAAELEQIDGPARDKLRERGIL
jgi:hypothetical protein